MIQLGKYKKENINIQTLDPKKNLNLEYIKTILNIFN